MSTTTRADLLDPAVLRALTDELARHGREHDLTGTFPAESVTAAHAAGVLTSLAAPGIGQDLTTADFLRLVQALGAGDPGAALVISQTALFHLGERLAPSWPAALYERVVEENRERPVLVGGFRSEPEMGSSQRGALPDTTAVRTDAGWVVTGRKNVATGVEGASYAAVWATVHDGDTTPYPTDVIIPLDAPGVRVERTWDHLGLRTSGSHTAVFEDVLVPHENLVVPGAAAQGYRSARHLSTILLMFPTLYLGVARAAEREFHDYVRTRVPTGLGRPLSTTERMRNVAGEIDQRLWEAETVLHTIAGRIDAGEEVPDIEVFRTKLIIERAAKAAVELAARSLGNAGLTRGRDMERHLRDVQCAHVHGPQEDLVLLRQGTAILEDTASREGGAA